MERRPVHRQIWNPCQSWATCNSAIRSGNQSSSAFWEITQSSISMPSADTWFWDSSTSTKHSRLAIPQSVNSGISTKTGARNSMSIHSLTTWPWMRTPTSSALLKPMLQRYANAPPAHLVESPHTDVAIQAAGNKMVSMPPESNKRGSRSSSRSAMPWRRTLWESSF